MKNLILFMLAAVIVIACKKKKKDPEPEPEKVCQTGNSFFAGKYKYQQANHDTIEVVFTKNDCPHENCNYYMVKGIGKAINPIVSNTTTVFQNDYSVYGTETDPNAPFAEPVNHEFKLTRLTNGNLSLSCLKLQAQTSTFIKIN